MKTSLQAAQDFCARVNHSLARRGLPMALTPDTKVGLSQAGRVHTRTTMARLAHIYEGSPSGTWAPEDLLATGFEEGDAVILGA